MVQRLFIISSTLDGTSGNAGTAGIPRGMFSVVNQHLVKNIFRKVY